MKTLEEIKAYIKTHDAITPTPLNLDKAVEKADKHFQYVLSQVKPEEDIKFAMISNGVYSGETPTMGGTGIFLITNRRIIYGQRAVLTGDIIKFVNLDDCLDASASTYGILSGKVTIQTRTEKCSLTIERKKVDALFALINDAIQQVLAEQKAAPQVVVAAAPPSRPERSLAAELKELKELLDMGVLSQEEFDEQKKKLLNK